MRQKRYGPKKLIEMLFIDANIFLEVVLGDKRKEECKALFLRIQNNTINAVTSDFILYTCLLQIENKVGLIGKMQNFMIFLDNLEGLRFNSPNNETIYRSFELMKKHKLDFDDALIIAIMKALGIKELVSFDKHFDDVKEIKRIEPKDIV